MVGIDFSTLDDSQKLNILLERTECLDGIKSDLISIKEDITNVKNRLDTAETTLKEFGQLQTSVTFLSEKYDKLLADTSTLKDKIKSLETDNQVLNKKIGQFNNKLSTEKAERNEEGQYHRTAHNVKILGVSLQKGEENSERVTNPVTTQVVMKICEKAGIRVELSDIDVCHRLGQNEFSAILLHFGLKTDALSGFRGRI